MIAIIDYKMGNIRSVSKLLKRLKSDVLITSDHKQINEAEKIIIPGVGHFAKGMQNLDRLNLLSVLQNKVINSKTPILGICLGMQLFSKFSEEGNSNGLNWIDATVKKFNYRELNNKYKIPHMGWNSIKITSKHSLLEGISNQNSFYFAHSYYISCKSSNNVISRTSYGIEFDSAIVHNNIYGLQFHPEKSHSMGMRIIKNFISL